MPLWQSFRRKDSPLGCIAAKTIHGILRTEGWVYSGYIASGDELVELRRANKLNIRGIRDLG